jgi:hypothetical protein
MTNTRNASVNMVSLCLSATRFELVDSLFQDGSLRQIGIRSKEFFPNGYGSVRVFFARVEHDTLVEQCLGKRRTVLQDAVQNFDGLVVLSQVMQARSEVRFDPRIPRF